VNRVRRFRLALPTLAALLLPAPGFAHAVVLESRPSPNAQVGPSDHAVALRFNSRIDRKRSRMTLAGPGGASVPVAVAEGSEPDRLEAALPALDPGDYKLKWQVLSIDGHITRGEIPFHVGRR
jgi:copper resistance protein C